MSSDAYDLSALASEPYKGLPEYNLIRSSIFFLLDHQHAQDYHLNMKRKVGSEMGLQHNGHAAEITILGSGRNFLLQQSDFFGITLRQN